MMSRSLILGALMATVAQSATAETLLVRTYSGLVSASGGLTKAECTKVRGILLRTGVDMTKVRQEYQRLADKDWTHYHRELAWRAAHPQCKHVSWSGCAVQGSTCTPIDRAQPIAPTKDGWCNFPMGTEDDALGSKDTLENQSPATNPLILKYDWIQAYHNLGLTAPGEDGKPDGIKSVECLK